MQYHKKKKPLQKIDFASQGSLLARDRLSHEIVNAPLQAG
jgi:hypothetical protein